MDQFVVLFGEAQKALMLDCRSLEFQLLPLPDTVNLVICNTMVKHALASSAYNERRAQCEYGVQHLKQWLPHLKALRDVTLEELEEFGKDLPDVVFRRCRHVITENARVLSAAEALEHERLFEFGEMMAASHHSLRNDYEVSSRDLDVMVELAGRIDGVYGARMTGGGFGGCTINIVDAKEVERFKSMMARDYQRFTDLKPEIYICEASNGAEEI